MSQFDDVAGEIHPSKGGPCTSFLPDGRSEICVSCDWPKDAHAETGRIVGVTGVGWVRKYDE